jgi:hypothetical protein
MSSDETMAERNLDADAVIRKWSKELGLKEKAVRQFVERNSIDAVALDKEKWRVTQRKLTLGRRFLLAGTTGAVRDFTIGTEEVPS